MSGWSWFCCAGKIWGDGVSGPGEKRLFRSCDDDSFGVVWIAMLCA